MTQPLTEDLPDLPTPPTGTQAAPDDAAGGLEPRSKLLDLSLTQLLGGSMAAATAAALGSRLGVVGTIAGAAVLSVVSAIAGTLYTNSMARARDAVVLVRSRRGVVVGRLPQAVPLLADSPRSRRGRSRPDHTTGRRALLTAGAVFALAAAFLAGLQLATGAPVTGTDLGGRTAAGVVVDGSAGSAGGTSGEKTDDGAQGSSRADTATESPTGTSSGTPAPVAATPPSVATTDHPAAQTAAATSATAPPATGGSPQSPPTSGPGAATAPAGTPAP